MSDAEVKGYLNQLEATRRTILEQLEALERSELRYATDHWRWNTLRRVLLRFGDHVREHTTQLEAAREATGASPTMPQRILARAQEAHGLLLGATVGLQDEHLDRAPEPGEWTPRQVLEHVIETQRLYLGMIQRARESAQPVERD